MKKEKIHLLRRPIGKYLQISLRSAFLSQECKGYWLVAVLILAALQVKPLVAHAACSPSLR